MKKRLRNILLVLGIIIIFAGIIYISILSEKTTMNPDGTIGNTAGNLNNLGLFCESNGIVYFSNPYDGGSLYSMNPDESNIQKLGSVPVELLNAGGDYLYYFQTAANGAAGLGYMRTRNGIYRSDLNGKNSICLSPETAFSMQLINNHLYYLTSDSAGPHFSKQKIDKSGEVVLSDTLINPACVVNNTIYFNGTEHDHALYALDTTTDTITTVWEGNLWNPIVYGDYVYYMDVPNNYRLCRYSFTDNVIEVLTEDRIDTYNLCGDMIYYQKNSSIEPSLMRMGLDGSNPEVVAEGIYSHINATSQYVYFHAFESTIPTYRTPIEGPVAVTTFDAALNAAMTGIN